MTGLLLSRGRRLRRRVERRLAGHDLVLIGAAVALAALGVLLVGAATRRHGVAFPARQGLWVLVGVGVMTATAVVDLEVVRRGAHVLYLAGLAGLLLVLSPLGASTNGAQAWFSLGPLALQPAELMKPVLVVALAAHGVRAGGPLDGRRLLGGLVLLGVPVGLVLLQPDLGTAMVLVSLTAGVVAVAGARARHLAVLALLGVLAVAGVLRAGVLAPYQVERLTGFLHQSHDPRGATWNLEQAKIAIGSGGIAGEGLFSGSQTRLAYVPEQHTDFVFTVVGEELGLVGGATVLALFALLAWRIWRVAWRSTDPFAALCCAGVLAMLVFQVTENVGMTMGITPITGIPLPFLSYGGSSMLASFAGVGLAANAASRCRSGEAGKARNWPRATGANGLPAARLVTT
ncbi:MAG TPA: rod shape-determining protein RodA [Acidimicrobiia bacterium]|nr:rod shape-determining protein RodA [Acidimicrobiia bacterium]